jgi:hypothetical protein
MGKALKLLFIIFFVIPALFAMIVIIFTNISDFKKRKMEIYEINLNNVKQTEIEFDFLYTEDLKLEKIIYYDNYKYLLICIDESIKTEKINELLIKTLKLDSDNELKYVNFENTIYFIEENIKNYIETINYYDKSTIYQYISIEDGRYSLLLNTEKNKAYFFPYGTNLYLYIQKQINA